MVAYLQKKLKIMKIKWNWFTSYNTDTTREAVCRKCFSRHQLPLSICCYFGWVWKSCQKQIQISTDGETSRLVYSRHKLVRWCCSVSAWSSHQSQLGFLDTQPGQFSRQIEQFLKTNTFLVIAPITILFIVLLFRLVGISRTYPGESVGMSSGHTLSTGHTEGRNQEAQRASSWLGVVGGF